MNLLDLHQIEGYEGLSRLALKVGASPKYLWQCATDRRFPSPQLAWRLVEAEPRLKFEALYRGAQPADSRKARSNEGRGHPSKRKAA